MPAVSTDSDQIKYEHGRLSNQFHLQRQRRYGSRPLAQVGDDPAFRAKLSSLIIFMTGHFLLHPGGGGTYLNF
jgi:hypothetical protein